MTEEKRREVNWFCYLHYLIEWAKTHKEREYIGCSPACYDEWACNEGEDDD